MASAFSFWYRRQRSLSESITFRSRFRTVLPWDVRPLKTFWYSALFLKKLFPSSTREKAKVISSRYASAVTSAIFRYRCRRSKSPCERSLCRYTALPFTALTTISLAISSRPLVTMYR